MFDIGWTELLVIAVVAIVVIGPKDLPRAMRTVGQWTGKMKRMAREFQGQFNEALREAELDGRQEGRRGDRQDRSARPTCARKCPRPATRSSKSLDETAAPATDAPAADMQTPAAGAEARVAAAGGGRAPAALPKYRPAASDAGWTERRRRMPSREREAETRTRSRRAGRRCSTT